MKNEQPPQTRMTEGLQGDVLRLSTAGCTVDVGKLTVAGRPEKSQAWISTRQQDSSAAQVGQLRLQCFDLRFAYRQL